MLQWILTCCWTKKSLSCGLESNGRNEEESGVEGPLAILWDIDNCCIPSGLSPEIVVDNTRKYLCRHGIKAPITLFSAYGDFTNRSSSWRESCQWSGVNFILVSNRKKDAADKAILVDMLLFAMDNPPPSSILLISGDVDFAAALHKLGQRGHSILVAATNLTQTPNALLSAAKFVWEWPQMASDGKFQIATERFELQTLPNVAGNYSETIRESNPALSMQISKRPNNCGLFAESPETTSKLSPASLTQDSKLKQSGIDDVKEEILSLIHRKGGCITLGEISVLYQHHFQKTLNRKRCGCRLKKFLEKMGDDIHIHGQGNTACVYLISQGKCLCPQPNTNSDASNHKNVTGNYSKTIRESNPDLSMQVSKRPNNCGGVAETTSKPSPASLMQDSKLKQSGIDVVKEEILDLIHRKGRCIPLSEISVLYQHTFGKILSRKSNGCKLKTLLKNMGDDIHIHGEGNTACVYLISQGKCLCPLSIMNSDAPNHKNVTGCGLPAE